jgi:hypothetical protein
VTVPLALPGSDEEETGSIFSWSSSSSNVAGAASGPEDWGLLGGVPKLAVVWIVVAIVVVMTLADAMIVLTGLDILRGTLFKVLESIREEEREQVAERKAMT